MKELKRTSLEIEEVVKPVEVVTNTYERDFIEEQIKQITAQRDEMIALKEAELQKCMDILAQMDAQGIVSKKVQDEEIAIEVKQMLEVKEEIINEVIE